MRLAGAVGVACVVSSYLWSSGPAVAAIVAMVAGGVAWWVLGRLEPSSVRKARERVGRDLPFAVDLFASCVAAGATTSRALTLAGSGVGGPVGRAFERTAAALVLGASVGESVAPWRDDPVLAPLDGFARMLRRSATSGVAVVPSATRLVDDLRDARRWEVDAIARRVGVRATAPLGACFLPAFVLLGIVPIVVAGARSVGV